MVINSFNEPIWIFSMIDICGFEEKKLLYGQKQILTKKLFTRILSLYIISLWWLCKTYNFSFLFVKTAHRNHSVHEQKNQAFRWSCLTQKNNVGPPQKKFENYFMVLVLLSPSVERFSVSRMRDLFIGYGKTCTALIKKVFKFLRQLLRTIGLSLKAKKSTTIPCVKCKNLNLFHCELCKICSYIWRPRNLRDVNVDTNCYGKETLIGFFKVSVPVRFNNLN